MGTTTTTTTINSPKPMFDLKSELSKKFNTDKSSHSQLFPNPVSTNNTPTSTSTDNSYTIKNYANLSQPTNAFENFKKLVSSIGVNLGGSLGNFAPYINGNYIILMEHGAWTKVTPNNFDIAKGMVSTISESSNTHTSSFLDGLNEIKNQQTFVTLATDVALPEPIKEFIMVSSRNPALTIYDKDTVLTDFSISYLDNYDLNLIQYYEVWHKFIEFYKRGYIWYNDKGRKRQSYIEANCGNSKFSKYFYSLPYLNNLYILAFDMDMNIRAAFLIPGIKPTSMPLKQILGNRGQNRMTTYSIQHKSTGQLIYKFYKNSEHFFKEANQKSENDNSTSVPNEFNLAAKIVNLFDSTSSENIKNTGSTKTNSNDCKASFANGSSTKPIPTTLDELREALKNCKNQATEDKTYCAKIKDRLQAKLAAEGIQLGQNFNTSEMENKIKEFKEKYAENEKKRLASLAKIEAVSKNIDNMIKDYEDEKDDIAEEMREKNCSNDSTIEGCESLQTKMTELTEKIDKLKNFKEKIKRSDKDGTVDPDFIMGLDADYEKVADVFTDTFPMVQASKKAISPNSKSDRENPVSKINKFFTDNKIDSDSPPLLSNDGTEVKDLTTQVLVNGKLQTIKINGSGNNSIKVTGNQVYAVLYEVLLAQGHTKKQIEEAIEVKRDGQGNIVDIKDTGKGIFNLPERVNEQLTVSIAKLLVTHPEYFGESEIKSNTKPPIPVKKGKYLAINSANKEAIEALNEIYEAHN